MRLNGINIRKSGVINNLDLFFFLLKKSLKIMTFEKIFNISKLFFSRITGKKIGFSPFFILTDSANTCDLDCEMCFSNQINHKEKDYVKYSITDFRKTLEKYHNSLLFVMFGCLWEPTTDPELWDMIGLCHKYKVLPFLTTNLVNTDIDKMIKSNIPYIQISISAGDRESYKKLHGKDCFLKVIHNLKYLSRESRKKKDPVYIHVKSVLTKRNDNMNTIKKLAYILKRLEIDKYSLKKFQSVRSLKDNKEILPDNRIFSDMKTGIERFEQEKSFRNNSMRYIGPDNKECPNEAVYLLRRFEKGL